MILTDLTFFMLGFASAVALAWVMRYVRIWNHNRKIKQWKDSVPCCKHGARLWERCEWCGRL